MRSSEEEGHRSSRIREKPPGSLLEKLPCSQTSLGPSRNCALSTRRGFANFNSASESDSWSQPSRPLPASCFFQVEKLRLRLEKCLALSLQPVKVTVPYLITVPSIFPPNEAESRRNSGLKRTDYKLSGPHCSKCGLQPSSIGLT